VADGASLQTLLCVEDNPANMELVRQLVARIGGIKLLSAITGAKGLELARSARPAAILMDINLPDMTGVAALKILQADLATASIPVVALSANAMPQDIIRGIETGFFRYLTKPINVSNFNETLKLTLEFAEAQRILLKARESVR
jgi:CheY-like chemotaxis protein